MLRASTLTVAIGKNYNPLLDNDRILIPPSSTEVLTSQESLRVPYDLRGVVHLEHHYALKGLIMMPFLLMPGFSGKIDMPVYWPSENEELRLDLGAQIAYVVYQQI